MEKPLVSVIMPVYNGEKYIGKAIESVLAQNVPTELLVIDDCSTDKTELTVMKYMDSGNIRYIRNKENMGAARSRNQGVKASKGKFIAFLDFPPSLSRYFRYGLLIPTAKPPLRRIFSQVI